MKPNTVRALAGLGDGGGDRRDRRAGRRPVPGQLHRNRSGDGDLGSRRPGDEPRRQGEDARRPGRQGVVHRVATRRHGGPAPGDGSRRSCISFPSNVDVDIASSTVFGAKFVELVAPANPSAEKLHDGQVIQSQHVTVEINTVFQQLVTVLDKIDPAKLNETLGAIATAFNGRGEKIGTDADRLQRASWPRSNRACRTSATTSRPLSRRSTPTPMRRPTSSRPSRIRRSSAIPSSTSSRTSTSSWSAQSVWPTSATT